MYVFRRMFFTSLGETPKIESATLKGTERAVLVHSRQIVRPQSLTLDLANKHLYWMDSYLDRIERINYDGTNRKLIIKHRVKSHQCKSVLLSSWNLPSC